MSQGTIYTFKELMAKKSLLNRVTLNVGNFARNISYAISTGKLINLRRGIYASDHNYDKLELATKIYKPSYISFETVLAREGVVFQHYSSIMVATYKTLNIICDKNKIKYRKLKDSVLYNSEGIINKGSYSIASKERAILDLLYLHKKYYFDNLRSIDWVKMIHISKIYNNKKLENEVNEIYKKYAKHK